MSSLYSHLHPIFDIKAILCNEPSLFSRIRQIRSIRHVNWPTPALESLLVGNAANLRELYISDLADLAYMHALRPFSLPELPHLFLHAQNGIEKASYVDDAHGFLGEFGKLQKLEIFFGWTPRRLPYFSSITCSPE